MVQVQFMDTHLRFRCWRAAEGTCCFSAGVCVRWAAGCGCLRHSWFQAASTADLQGCCQGWTLPCHSWREADPAGQIRSLLTTRWRPHDAAESEDVYVNLHKFSVGWSSGQCRRWFYGICLPTLGSGQQSRRPQCRGCRSRLNLSYAASEGKIIC